MTSIATDQSLYVREQIARIDRLLADNMHNRHEQQTALWQIVVTCMAAGAAIFACGAGSFLLLFATR